METMTERITGALTAFLLMASAQALVPTVPARVVGFLGTNNAPVIAGDTLYYTTDEDLAAQFCVGAIDADGDTIDVTGLLSGPFNGNVSGLADGDTCFTYVPNADFFGSDTLIITVCDNHGGCDQAVVVITVDPVNDAPIILDGIGLPTDTVAVSLVEDVPTTFCLNAFDADGDALQVSDFANGPFHGFVNGFADGDTCFTFTPTADYNGADTVDIIVCDGNGACDTVTVVLDVTPVNDPPVIDDGFGNPMDTLIVTTPMDTPINLCIPATDADGDALDFTGFTNGPTNGSIFNILDGNACFTYAPNSGYAGPDSVNMVMSDGNGGTDTLVLIINVPPFNVPPIADEDTVHATTSEDTSLLLCLGASDPDGDPIDVTAVISGPFHGIVLDLLDDDTCFTYMPASDWFGTDTMIVLICDPLNACDTVMVIIDVIPVNDAPIITDDGGVPIDTLNASTDEDTPIILCLDAIDADGDTLDIVSVFNGPLNGQATGTLSGDTCFTYTPNADLNGPDTMSVVVCDGNGGCDTVVVIVDVVPVNDAPIALDDSAATLLNVSVVIAVQDNDSDIDGDPLTTFSATAGNGSVTVNGDGTITYLPNSGWCGTDTITYVVSDGNGGMDTAIVVVDVACVNSPPVAVNDNVTTAPGTSIAIDVLINDSDPDGDVIGVISVSALHGSAILNGDTSITYTPDSGFCGVDTVSYTIADGNGGTDDAIVIVNVPCPNVPPTAVNDTAGVEMDAEVVIDILDNDGDPNGDPLTVTDASANNGTVFINGDGTISYAPHAGFCGNDTITYTICDPGPLCDTAFVIVEVLCPDALLIPGGFSPNGDNIADTWVIQGLEEFPQASVTIFNRWGNTVFSADPYANDWTGVSTLGLTIGDVLPAGTYWYLLDLGVEGEEVRSGYIYLNK